MANGHWFCFENVYNKFRCVIKIGASNMILKVTTMRHLQFHWMPTVKEIMQDLTLNHLKDTNDWFCLAFLSRHMTRKNTNMYIRLISIQKQVSNKI